MWGKPVPSVFMLDSKTFESPAVTGCTTSLTLNKYTFCPCSALTQTANFALNNTVVAFITEMANVYCIQSCGGEN
jgi:hypothetical protein